VFLITTADQRFWKTDEQVLFLGEWCKLFSQRSVWEKLSYEVLPYHWDDRKTLYKDYLYLDKLYEQILFQMKDNLNKLHGVNYSLRYWRIVIGPWLYWFIQILYDRYKSIQKAIESRKVTNTFICRYDEAKWLPRDFPCFRNCSINDDDYNQYIYGLIIEYTSKIHHEFIGVNGENNPSEEVKGIENHFVLRKFKKIIEVCGKIIPDHLNRVVLISSFLSTLDRIKVQLSLKQIPHLFSPDVLVPVIEMNMDAREGLLFNLPEVEFERLLGKMIRKQIPLIYIEGYAQMNERSLRAYPKKPEVIFTANAYYSNEAFKFWAGYNVERGAKLVGTQHGGHYGTGLWSSLEKHELQICDIYYTWGWKSDIYKNTKVLAAAKLNKAKRNIRQKKDGRVLLVLAALPRYSYHMYSAPVAASGILSYINDQYRFVRALSKENQQLLLVRLFGDDRGWSQRERWNSELPGIECYQGDKSIIEQTKESRLIVCTYNATTYLEMFVANFPTVIFWNHNHWELRPSAHPYFEELRRVGIFHDTPESAAGMVNEICHNPMSWWNQSEIQQAKDIFCDHFARTSDEWLDEWKKELNRVLINSN